MQFTIFFPLTSICMHACVCICVYVCWQESMSHPSALWFVKSTSLPPSPVAFECNTLHRLGLSSKESLLLWSVKSEKRISMELLCHGRSVCCSHGGVLKEATEFLLFIPIRMAAASPSCLYRYFAALSEKL